MAYENFKEEFEFLFGKLTSKQLWLLVRFAKYVRLRARNNVAFNNLANRIFPYAKFRQIEKTNTKDGTKYMGLSLVVDGEEFKPEVPEIED